MHGSKSSASSQLLLSVASFESAVKMLFSSVAVIVILLQSNTFSSLPTDDENVSDRKENENETNRKSPPDDKVYQEK